MSKFVLLVLTLALIPGAWFYLMDRSARAAGKKALRRWIPLLLFGVVVAFALVAFFTQVQAIRLL